MAKKRKKLSAHARRIRSIQRAHKKRTGKKLSDRAAEKVYKSTKKFIDKELKKQPTDLAERRKKKWVRIAKKGLLSGKISAKRKRHVLSLIDDLTELSQEEIEATINSYARKEDSGVYKFMEWAKKKGIF